MNRELRLKLCSSPIIDRNGEINHEYFADVPGNHWSESDQQLLLQGIERFGVGNYEDINQLLPTKSDIEIRLRTCLLLGVHCLEEYKGLKDTSKITEIRNRNVAQGKKTGKLKYGIFLNK